MVYNIFQAEKALPRMAMLAGLVLLFSILSPINGFAQEHPGKAAMDSKTNFLFIHHSCGGMLLADPGATVGGERGSGNWCIYSAHPNGGGLRTMLEDSGYQVNELSYESQLGEDTDIQHWRAKFADHMDQLLRTGKQDEFLPEGQSNRIVAFKSCYPNNYYVGLGEEPGDPDSSERTVANSKAAYNSLLSMFEENPDVLFVAFTAPPLAEPKPRGFKAKLKAMFKGKSKAGEFARQFNDWMVDAENGWLGDYALKNVVVFNYYDILTDNGQSNWSMHPTRDGADSHPSATGNALAAEVFVPFLAESVTDWEGAGK